jgi:hypothetical protein
VRTESLYKTDTLQPSSPISFPLSTTFYIWHLTPTTNKSHKNTSYWITVLTHFPFPHISTKSRNLISYCWTNQSVSCVISHRCHNCFHLVLIVKSVIAKIFDDQRSAINPLDTITISAGYRSWRLTDPEDESNRVLRNVCRSSVTSQKTGYKHTVSPEVKCSSVLYIYCIQDKLGSIH